MAKAFDATSCCSDGTTRRREFRWWEALDFIPNPNGGFVVSPLVTNLALAIRPLAWRSDLVKQPVREP